MRAYLRRGRTATWYCADIKCEGASGFEVTEVPATETDPPYWLTDTCPYCGHDEWREEPMDWGYPAEALVDALDELDLIPFPTSELDTREVMAVVLAEVERQRSERDTAAREATRATPETQAAIDALFPPTEDLSFLGGPE